MARGGIQALDGDDDLGLAVRALPGAGIERWGRRPAVAALAVSLRRRQTPKMERMLDSRRGVKHP